MRYNSCMGIREERRAEAVELIADHILQQGLGGASLRPMAEAAGISDRMLLYYFADRADVLEAALHAIAARLASMLEQGSGRKQKLTAFLPAVCATLQDEGMRPYMRLWLELAAAAARQEEPHSRIAHAIAKMFLQWVEEQVEIPGGPKERARTAAIALAFVEGVTVLDAVGLSGEVDVKAAARRLSLNKPHQT